MSLSEYRNPTSARKMRNFFECLCAINWICWGAQAYPNLRQSVGWGKTRAQQAPHPNTPISKITARGLEEGYYQLGQLNRIRNTAVGLRRSFLAANSTYSCW